MYEDKDVLYGRNSYFPVLFSLSDVLTAPWSVRSYLPQDDNKKDSRQLGLTTKTDLNQTPQKYHPNSLPTKAIGSFRLVPSGNLIRHIFSVAPMVF